MAWNLGDFVLMEFSLVSPRRTLAKIFPTCWLPLSFRCCPSEV